MMTETLSINTDKTTKLIALDLGKLHQQVFFYRYGTKTFLKAAQEFGRQPQ
jgi:hypothetical protein